MRGNSSIKESVVSTQPNSTQQADVAQLNTICGLLVILLPIAFYGAIAIYRKHQARIMQRHIQRLNRTWQLSSSEKLS